MATFKPIHAPKPRHDGSASQPANSMPSDSTRTERADGVQNPRPARTLEPQRPETPFVTAPSSPTLSPVLDDSDSASSAASGTTSSSTTPISTAATTPQRVATPRPIGNAIPDLALLVPGDPYFRRFRLDLSNYAMSHWVEDICLFADWPVDEPQDPESIELEQKKKGKWRIPKPNVRFMITRAMEMTWSWY